jgi:AAA domain, putative AbiEii toxin, Type IV TA system
MNRPAWKLLVEGLGKIERAEVAVHPLMLFVGDNNSGKSYLASLLWGLVATPRTLPMPVGEALSACEAWLTRRRAEREHGLVYELSTEDRVLFTQLFNELIRKDDILVKQVFNSPAMTAARIEITPLHDRAVSVGWEPVDREGHVGDNVLYLRDDMVNHPRLGESYRASVLKHLASMCALGVSPGSGRGSSMFYWEGDPVYQGDPIYLPASRSGFMLMYKAVAQRGYEEAVQFPVNGEESLRMSRPASEFVKLLAFEMTKQEGPYAAEASLLENGLDGRIELSSGPVGINEYAYRLAGSLNILHLSLASSLVTELAPIILVLRHLSGFPILVLEEPEAHLHPKVQRLLAQVIVRLVRKGLYVWITTHSENFCQQINDFMKIGAVPDRAKLAAEMQKTLGYAYGEQDYLTPADVAGYEFVNQGEHSVVRALAKHPDGLVMPTFNREMVAIAREVTFLEQQLDGEA